MNENAGPYKGLDRFEAREARAGRSGEAAASWSGKKDYVVPLGKCDRCKTIIEPRLSTQWFVQDPAAGRSRYRSCRERRDQVRSRELHQDLLRVDAQHPRLVHLAPAVVGTSHSRVALQDCGEIIVAREAPAQVHQVRRRAAGAGQRRARHLVLLRAAAVLGPRLARQARPTSTPSIRPRC